MIVDRPCNINNSSSQWQYYLRYDVSDKQFNITSIHFTGSIYISRINILVSAPSFYHSTFC